MNKPVIEVSCLTKTFLSPNERLIILNNLKFNVEHTAKISIIGESGSGKSTFLNILGGLEAADSGQILAGDYKVHELDEKGLTEYRSSFLGLVFQFHYLLKDFTALENVMLPALIAGQPKKTVRERALSLLEDVRLADRKDHFPAQLSGGERQRAAVARALINEPSLVLADEPTGNLDHVNSKTVQDLLFSITDKHKKTLIVVTHDSAIASLTDVCYKLHGGVLERV